MGQPKAWLPFGDESMLERVVRLLSQAVSPIVVVAAIGQDLPVLPPGSTVIHDPLPDRGPLQGLAAGLGALDDSDSAYVTSCDAPFLRPAFARRMIELLGDFQACVPHVGGRLHPLVAVYRREVLPLAEERLAAGQLGMTPYCGRLRTRFVHTGDLTAVDPGLESLININTPADYEAALDRERRCVGPPVHPAEGG
jgi:molybdopterin-guanine dinucleotide biosynthesis protein A